MDCGSNLCWSQERNLCHCNGLWNFRNLCSSQERNLWDWGGWDNISVTGLGHWHDMNLYIHDSNLGNEGSHGKNLWVSNERNQLGGEPVAMTGTWQGALELTGTFGTVADSEATGKSAEMERPHMSAYQTQSLMKRQSTCHLCSVGRLVSSAKTSYANSYAPEDSNGSILCKKMGEMSIYYFKLYHILSLIIIWHAILYKVRL